MTDLIICPHCGRVVDLTDPRLKRLTPAAFAVYHRIQDYLKRGERLGASKVGRLAGLTPSGARYHLEQLRRAKLVIAVPKVEDGIYKVYQAA